MRRSCRSGREAIRYNRRGRTSRPRDERRNCNSLYFVVSAQTRKKTFGSCKSRCRGKAACLAT